MAKILNAVMSDQSANSYVDVAYADAYFGGHVNTVKSATWTALSPDQKVSALVQACWVIEQLKFTVPTQPWDSSLQYDNQLHRNYYTSPAPPGSAVRYSSLQNLQFPRDVDLNSTGQFIPEEVKDAQCEQAVFLATTNDSVLTKSMQGVVAESFEGGGIKISQRFATEVGGSAGTLISPIAKQFLNPYILRASGMRLRRS